MKRTVLFTLFICLLTIVGCQHELQWNRSSAGTLLKNANGDCLPVTVAGNFISNKIISDSNFLTVRVDVSVKGNYIITSDIVNGY